MISNKYANGCSAGLEFGFELCGWFHVSFQPEKLGKNLLTSNIPVIYYKHMASTSGNTLTDQAYRHIRAELAAGELRPGTQLSESSIAKQIGVGRTPIREAMLLLENEGFIQQIPRYGTFVRKAGRHERQWLYEMREVLESYAARRAAEYMSDAQIVQLGELCDEIRTVVREIRDSGKVPTDDMVARLAVADLAFHMLVLRASGNPLVIRTVNNLHLMGRIWGSDTGDPYRRSLRHRAESWREHVRVFRAIRQRKPDQAAHWMSVHLHHATVMALEYYDRQCRTEGADAVGFEWPEKVREALLRIERLGPEFGR